jgi:hypothetical protein
VPKTRYFWTFWEAERERGVAKRISQFGGVKQGESVEGDKRD